MNDNKLEESLKQLKDIATLIDNEVIEPEWLEPELSRLVNFKINKLLDRLYSLTDEINDIHNKLEAKNIINEIEKIIKKG